MYFNKCNILLLCLWNIHVNVFMIDIWMLLINKFKYKNSIIFMDIDGIAELLEVKCPWAIINPEISQNSLIILFYCSIS